jgi:hypothetical protein
MTGRRLDLKRQIVSPSLLGEIRSLSHRHPEQPAMSEAEREESL